MLQEDTSELSFAGDHKMSVSCASRGCFVDRDRFDRGQPVDLCFHRGRTARPSPATQGRNPETRALAKFLGIATCQPHSLSRTLYRKGEWGWVALGYDR